MEEDNRWREVFSDGVWELEIVGSIMRAYKTRNDPQDYEPGELSDNGIATVENRARDMGKELVIVEESIF